MLTTYIRAAMHRAKYEILPDDATFYGHIPELNGVWANAETLEACREELEEVLEEWILFRVSQNLPLPAIDNIVGLPAKLVKHFLGNSRDRLRAFALFRGMRMPSYNHITQCRCARAWQTCDEHASESHVVMDEN